MNESKYKPNPNGEYQRSRGAKNDYGKRQNSSFARNSESFDRVAQPNYNSSHQWRNQFGSRIEGDENMSSGQEWPSVGRSWNKHQSPDIGNNHGVSKDERGTVVDSVNQTHSMAKYTVKKREDAGAGSGISHQQQRPRPAAAALSAKEASASPGPDQFSGPSPLASDPGAAGGEAEWPSLSGHSQSQQPLPRPPPAASRATRPAAAAAAPTVASAAATAAAAPLATPSRGGTPGGPRPRAATTAVAAPLPAPLRLVTPGGQFAASEEAQDCLEPGNTNFTVVGVLGLQAAGKSSVLNALLGNDWLPGDQRQQQHQQEFEVETLDNLVENSHCTRGVQLQITPERCLLLDCQALLALPSAESLIQTAAGDRRVGGGGGGSVGQAEFITVETGATMHGIQLSAFLMSVCHVVLVVLDGWPDPDLLRLLLTADMLRPAVLDDTEFQPRLVFVINRAPPGAGPAPQTVRDLLAGVFEAAAFRLEASDIFCLPLIDGAEDSAIEFTEELERLRRLILTAPRHHMLRQDLFNEKVWLEFSAQVWEDVQKSVMLTEYHRLIG